MNRMEAQPPHPTHKEGVREGYVLIDQYGPDILGALQSQSQKYWKSAHVTAKPVTTGEVVVTKLRDGTEETKRVAEVDGWKVTHALGEETFQTNAEFNKRYIPVDGAENEYKSNGKVYVHAIKNPHPDQKVAIKASWGDFEYGDADCYFVDTYTAETNEPENQPYIIGREEFETYYSAE